MEASTNVSQVPMLHSKGRYLAGMYYVTSSEKMMLLQEYIKHYTKRFESTTNTSLVKNELLEIHKEANSILNYYNKNLTTSSKIVQDFKKNIPKIIGDKLRYLEKHRGVIVVGNLRIEHIEFGIDFHDKRMDWTYQKHNTITTNNELAFFCAKLIGFIDKFEINQSATKKESQKIKLSIKQVALKYIYEGKSITRQNSNSIIKEYGHTSGDKLYNEYTRYSSKTNRIANEETEQKLKNKIKLIESVISLLSIENQEKPRKEITDLKAKLIID
ncbi:hypothetical protein [Tenacibaculum finnmarkense]|nr:hypothetical protein [Tenacibaculum finnmarkense]